MVKVGSIWRTVDDKRFMVINVVEAEGHTWVHYREHIVKKPVIECKEYSCYEESFVQRFSESPE